jgi:hypothetical protein
MQQAAAIRKPKSKLKSLLLVGAIPKTNKLCLQNIQSSNHEIMSSTISPAMRVIRFIVKCCHSQQTNKKLVFLFCDSLVPNPGQITNVQIQKSQAISSFVTCCIGKVFPV